MKKTPPYLLILFLSLITSNTYAENLLLDIKLIEGEKSKDSHEMLYDLTVKNKNIIYYQKSSGRDPRNINKKTNKEISNDEYQQILKILSDPIFDHPIQEIKPMDKLGNYIDLDIVLRKNESINHLKIKGMYHEMRTGQSNISNITLYRKIISIISLFKEKKY